jgi:geranylgeranyl diphosphate synthase, type II
MTFSFQMLQDDQQRIEHALKHWTQFIQDPCDDEGIPPLLEKGMAHSLLAGGKRLRPLLVLHAAKAIQPQWALEEIWTHCQKAAIAIEMIHTYSLIHDDLPALDNDDLRRGKPTCHKAYGEAQAILAGDGLLTDAFHILAQAPLNPNLQILELSRAAGSRGMVAGQVDDIAAETLPPEKVALKMIHTRKTARLLASACRLGGLCVGATTEQIQALTHYGFALGLGFQIADDVLDAIADPQKAGKSLGRDEAQSKVTYLTRMGLQGAKDEAKNYADRACAQAEKLPGNQEILMGLARFSAQRLY